MTTNDIVQKLWNLCDVLRDDGINYSDYVTELVLLLFLKMEYETGQNSGMLQTTSCRRRRWPDLTSKSRPEPAATTTAQTAARPRHRAPTR